MVFHLAVSVVATVPVYFVRGVIIIFCVQIDAFVVVFLPYVGCVWVAELAVVLLISFDGGSDSPLTVRWS